MRRRGVHVGHFFWARRKAGRTLVNATPIAGADGALASVVVAMQNLAPLRELERRRAEFPCMVSHELRAPLTALRPPLQAR